MWSWRYTLKRSAKNNRRLNKLKINDFSWARQRNEVSEQTTNLKSWGIGKSRITNEIYLPETEATKAINLQEHLTDNFDKLLEAECGLEWKWETPGSGSLGGRHTFMGFTSRNLTRFSECRSKKDTLVALAGRGEESLWISLWNMPRAFSTTEAYSPGGKTTRALFQSHGGRTSFSFQTL